MATEKMLNAHMHLKVSHKLLQTFSSYMHLKVCLDTEDEDLRQMYQTAIQTRNSLLLTSKYIDAGFDLIAPETIACVPGKINGLDFKVRCSAQVCTSRGEYPTGFYLYPRSSISKTKVRLANSVGIIDSGYRGHVMCMFDAQSPTEIQKGARYAQICAPSLMPIYVELVSEHALDETTRGSGGFGSTGL